MKVFLAFFFIIMVASMEFAQSRLLVTAHRGASGHAPENTLSSIQTAINMNADIAEIDVQETADGEIILLHDGSLKRTTGLDTNIWQLNYQDISELDAGSWFHKKFEGEKIPKLSDIIDTIKGKIKLNIELKTNKHEKELAERTVEVVKQKNFQDECFFTSFDYNQIRRVKEMDSTLKAGLIFSKIPDSPDIFTSDFEILSVHYSLVDRAFIDKAYENKKEVHVWTVNSEDEMQRLINLGVTSIITDYPDRLKRILK
jgi:glycerophosphoryl diester phosphodiesterase